MACTKEADMERHNTRGGTGDPTAKGTPHKPHQHSNNIINHTYWALNLHDEVEIVDCVVVRVWEDIPASVGILFSAQLGDVLHTTNTSKPIVHSNFVARNHHTAITARKVAMVNLPSPTHTTIRQNERRFEQEHNESTTVQ
jgi:hypothetical protein